MIKVETLIELIKKPWDYILYHNSKNDEYKLSVLCGSVGLFDVDIVLSTEQVSEYLLQGEEYINSLAKLIRENPRAYIQP